MSGAEQQKMSELEKATGENSAAYELVQNSKKETWRVRVLPPQLANMLWPTFVDRIKEAMSTHPSELLDTLPELRTDIRLGRSLVVQMYEDAEVCAIAVIEMVEQTDGRMLYIRYLAGEGMEHWLPELHELMTTVARQFGCNWFGLTGRLGWVKALKVYGFEPVAIELRAEV